MTNNLECTIGTIGQKWNAADKNKWFELQTVKRSYQNEVISKINALSSHFDIVQYSALSIDEQRYPLFALKSKHWQSDKSTVLVTGGVHGYETSGVQGALRFLKNEAANLTSKWNPKAIDPNRSFYVDSPAQESAALMAFIQSLDVDILVHVDLHETTDTDNSVFRPALSARDAVEQKVWNIPDGFYLVGNTLNPQAEFQQAIIHAVESVTHIAPADEGNKLIGVDIEQFGVINYPGRELGLCMGLTDANYVTTTEVYPDSPKSDDENCILAQVAAITGALDFILKKNNTL